MNKKRLQISQLDRRIKEFGNLKNKPTLNDGWIKSVRLALGMSMEQLAKKLTITKQAVKGAESREQQGNITFNNMRKIARALDMELVYGLVPKDGSLEALVERRAQTMAKEIVMRTSQTMKLEAQENSDVRIQNSIEELSQELMREIPSYLWD